MIKPRDFKKPWLFDGEEFTSEMMKTGKYEGFVYLIIEKETGRKYIGKKSFYSIRKVKGRSNRKKMESDWKTYWSSSDEIKQSVRELGEDAFEKHILSLHISFGDAGFHELKEQFARNVLEDPSYINDVIGQHRATTARIREGRKFAKEI